MKIQISEHFTIKKLLLFTLPMMVSTILASIYGVIDGIFISNLVSAKAFEAVNLILPYIYLFGAFGFMIGSGGTALVAKVLGEKDKERANRYFSMFVWALIVIGVVCAIVARIGLPFVASWLGAKDEIYDRCIEYGRIFVYGIPFFMLQFGLQGFLITEHKSNLLLLFSTLAGITNVVLDALLMGPAQLGVAGAGIGTLASCAVGGLITLGYFVFSSKSMLRLKWAKPEWRVIGKGCSNGLSEMVINIALSLSNILYNFQLMRILPDTGVFAYGVIMYVTMLFFGAFLGYSQGITPIVGYNLGAKNGTELRNIIKKSAIILGVGSIAMFALSEGMANPLAMIFAKGDDKMIEATALALRLYAICFLFDSFNTFSSAFFTGLNNGLISGIIAFMRTFVFQVIMIFVLPLIWTELIWVSMAVADFLCLIMCAIFIVAYSNRYRYSKKAIAEDNISLLGE